MYCAAPVTHRSPTRRDFPPGWTRHVGILQDFADAVLDGTPLEDRAHGGGRPPVELADAMLLSTFTGRTVTLSIDGAFYQRWLDKLAPGSKEKCLSLHEHTKFRRHGLRAPRQTPARGEPGRICVCGSAPRLRKYIDLAPESTAGDHVFLVNGRA